MPQRKSLVGTKLSHAHRTRREDHDKRGVSADQNERACRRAGRRRPLVLEIGELRVNNPMAHICR